MRIVIDIPEKDYDDILNGETKASALNWSTFNAIRDGVPLPKGHGRIVDISKIEEDRIDSNNPIIYLTVNGEYIEAVSLDYLNSLSTIIEADGGDAE